MVKWLPLDVCKSLNSKKPNKLSKMHWKN